MMVARMLVSRLAPLLACLGLLAIWQAGALTLSTESFPTALEALRAVPAILGDRESLVNILASLRGMSIAFSVALVVLELKKIELADYLPSLVVAPLITAIWR